ncbi:MAG: GAF domain-containing protein [Acidobacteria bacterium]|nr:GAF domain-containing protein [Acidobacteriota bacterium]
MEDIAGLLDAIEPSTDSSGGLAVTVEGVVTSKPILFKEFTHLAIASESGAALVLEGPDFMFEQVAPGDTLEVTGVVVQRDGMAILRPGQITTLSRRAPPVPQSAGLDTLKTRRYLGRFVTLQGRVVALGQDDNGEFLVVGDGRGSYTIYLPRAANRLGAGLNRYRVGDGIRATGIATTAAGRFGEAPGYRLEVSDASGVTLLDRSWLVSPQVLIAGLVILSIWGVGLFRQRQHRMTVRLSVRRIHGFAEEVLTSTTSEDAMRKLRNMAPRALEAGAVELYSYDRTAQQLLPMLPGGERSSIHVNAPRRELGKPLPASEARDAAIALCFRNRTPLHIPDTRRSPLFREAAGDGSVRAIVLLPMFAREELIGVFELLQVDRPRRFDTEELSALQHLANQISIVWQLLERQARREQLLRTERLAATGQVISGVAGELRAPLESILMLAHRLLEQDDPQARDLLDQSLRASAILHRYSQVARLEEATPVELNPVVRNAIESIRREIAPDVNVGLALWQDSLWVFASAAQLENVLRNMLLLAASAARVSQDRTLRVETALHARRVLLAIRYGALVCDESFPPDSSSAQILNFSVCKGIVHGMGGDIRVMSAGENACRIEMDFPVAVPSTAPSREAADGTREDAASQRFTPPALTALILEPDPATQKRLINFWTARKNRAVPVHNDTEALELMRRFRIDVIFCAVRFGAGNWVDFFDRVRGQTPVFILVADAIDPDETLFFPNEEGLLLRKPVESGEFSRLLDRIGQRLESCETEPRA